MVVTCHVHLLDGSEVAFEIGKNAKAKVLLDKVLERLDVVEKNYFGLIYRGSTLQKAWVKLDKKIKRQINKHDPRIEFDFAVKFYPSDPTKLKEEITRYQLCLQIRRDLASHLDCSIDKLTHLLSYWLQSEYEGKNDHSKVVRDCLKEFQNPPVESSTVEFIDRVLTLYRSRSGMSCADADSQFLATAAGLRTYGVHFYRGKETAGNDVMIGVSSRGVTEKREGQSPVSHPWGRIKNIAHKNNKFKIKLSRAPTGGDPRLKKAFLFDSESQVHSIWKNAVEHHGFFREKDQASKLLSDKKPKKKNSILRRLSSKKKPKSESEVQQESEGISRQQPSVTRVSSLRRPASIRPGSESKSTKSSEQPVGAVVETGGVQYSVLQQPRNESERLSSEEKKPPGAEDETALPLPPAIEAQTQIEAQALEEDEEGEREYKDDDILEAFAEKKEGTTSVGSSSLLLTETIPEEDEEEHLGELPSPRKPHRPANYALLRDGDVNLPSSSYQTEKKREKSARPIETNLDDQNLLRPQTTSYTWKHLSDDAVVVTYKEGAVQPGEDVRDSLEVVKPCEVAQMEATQVSGSIKESQRQSSTSSEEEDSFAKPQEDPQTLSLVEDEEAKIRAIPILTFDNLHNHPTDAENVEEDNFATIKEYVPRIRRESTEEDSEEDSDGDDSSEILRTREKQLKNKPANFPFGDFSIDGYHLPDVEEHQLVTQVESENLYKREDEDILHPPAEGNLSSLLRDSDEFFDRMRKEDRTEQDDTLQQEKNLEQVAEDSHEKIQEEVENDRPNSDELSKTLGFLTENFKESVKQESSNLLDIELSTVDRKKLYAPGDVDEKFRILDGVESTTAATIGDEENLAMEELDDEIMSEDQHFLQDDEVKNICEEKNELPPRPSDEETDDSVTESSEEDNEEQESEQTQLEEFPSRGIAGISEIPPSPPDLPPLNDSTDWLHSRYEEEEDGNALETVIIENVKGTETQKVLFRPEEDRSSHSHEDVPKLRIFDHDKYVAENEEEDECRLGIKISQPQREEVLEEHLILETEKAQLEEQGQTEEDGKQEDEAQQEKHEAQESKHDVEDVNRDSKRDEGTLDDSSTKAVAPLEIQKLTVVKESLHRTTRHELAIHFRIGEPYRSYAPGKTLEKDRILDYAASTTAATIGDGDDLAMEELDNEILSDEKLLDPNDGDGRNSEEQNESQPSALAESVSRSTSFSDITDNTDELLKPNALEKAWSQGAGLDEDDELFRVIFRTPPRRRKHRNRSEINPRDVRKGKQEVIAFRATIDEEPVSPRRRVNLTKRPFIPSWPFHPMSLFSSGDLTDLDQDTMRAVLDAQRELIEEDVMLNDVNFSNFGEEVAFRSRDVSPFRGESLKSDRVVVHPPSDGEVVDELLKARSRSPSASPRMVGGEFIPGVPDFVHSVVPFQLKTPRGSEQHSKASSLTSTPRVDPESMKFPKPVLKFRGPEVKNGPDSYRYSPPESVSLFPVAQCNSSGENITRLNIPGRPDHSQPELEQPGTSSGRSTPHSASGTASFSEEASSSASKSSASSFPRFIHSVFPFRRSSSNDRRGRSKTRRKREKKITKQKNKKKPRSKSSDKMSAKTSFPALEVSISPAVEAFNGFPVALPPAHQSVLAQTLDRLSSPTSEVENNAANVACPHYDQESLDKIILSESDDAHSESDTPETVRRIEGFMAHENKEPKENL